MFHIMVVEDDTELRDLFCAVLTEKGYHTLPAVDGVEAFDILERSYVDLIISDVMMPRMDGFELIEELRSAHYDMPILIITARDGLEDKRRGFRAGTDDYMVKPIDVNEMVWRVEALLRRSQINSERRITIGSTTLDCDTFNVSCSGTDTALPQKEFLLLFRLLSSMNRIFTRRQIMDEVWGVDSETDPHTLEVHISRLRERFRDNPDFELVTVRGLGYKAARREKGEA